MPFVSTSSRRSPTSRTVRTTSRGSSPSSAWRWRPARSTAPSASPQPAPRTATRRRVSATSRRSRSGRTECSRRARRGGHRYRVDAGAARATAARSSCIGCRADCAAGGSLACCGRSTATTTAARRLAEPDRRDRGRDLPRTRRRASVSIAPTAARVTTLSGADHPVPGDQRRQLVLGHRVRAGGAGGEDEVADRRAGVPHADLDVVGELGAELGQHGPRFGDGAGPVGEALVPDRRDPEQWPRVARAQRADDQVVHRCRCSRRPARCRPRRRRSRARPSLRCRRRAGAA